MGLVLYLLPIYCAIPTEDEKQPSNVTMILSTRLFIVLAPVRWDLMKEIKQAPRSETPFPECPSSKQYIPANLCHRVIRFTGYSQNHEPHPKVQVQFCAHYKPSLNGHVHTSLCILSLIAHVLADTTPFYSQLIPSLFHHFFWVYGFPEDIVSDRGTQFTSQVWTAFCNHLDIKVSLTSIYHPLMDKLRD